MSGTKNTQEQNLLEKARKYCAYQERSAFDLKEKLYEWNAGSELTRKIIKTLETENYLNDERFARVFTGGKFRMKKWGRNKIIAGLRAKRIPEKIIYKSLEEIDENEYGKTLRLLVSKKKEKFKAPLSAEDKNKIYNSMLRKGYESALIAKVLSVEC